MILVYVFLFRSPFEGLKGCRRHLKGLSVISQWPIKWEVLFELTVQTKLWPQVWLHSSHGMHSHRKQAKAWGTIQKAGRSSKIGRSMDHGLKGQGVLSLMDVCSFFRSEISFACCLVTWTHHKAPQGTTGKRWFSRYPGVELFLSYSLKQFQEVQGKARGRARRPRGA